jgi:hypothetical protein
MKDFFYTLLFEWVEKFISGGSVGVKVVTWGQGFHMIDVIDACGFCDCMKEFSPLFFSWWKKIFSGTMLASKLASGRGRLCPRPLFFSV